jgi:hypothetical protein
VSCCFNVSIFDVDYGHKSHEVMTVTGYSDIFFPEDPAFIETDQAPDLLPGSHRIKSRDYGSICDNPQHPEHLTSPECYNPFKKGRNKYEFVDMSKKYFTMNFKNQATFDMTFETELFGEVLNDNREKCCVGNNDYRENQNPPGCVRTPDCRREQPPKGMQDYRVEVNQKTKNDPDYVLSGGRVFLFSGYVDQCPPEGSAEADYCNLPKCTDDNGDDASYGDYSYGRYDDTDDDVFGYGGDYSYGNYGDFR